MLVGGWMSFHKRGLNEFSATTLELWTLVQTNGNESECTYVNKEDGGVLLSQVQDVLKHLEF